MLEVALNVRCERDDKIGEEFVLQTVRRFGVIVSKTVSSLDGVTLFCRGEVRALRQCAEQLAQIPSVNGVSMQRCDDVH